MPKYIVLEKSLVGNEIHEAGAEVEYDGLPAENLQPTCDEGRAKYQEYLESNAARVAALKNQYSESTVGDPDKFGAAVAKAIADANAEAAAANNASLAVLVSQAVAEAFATMFPNGANKAAVKDLV